MRRVPIECMPNGFNRLGGQKIWMSIAGLPAEMNLRGRVLQSRLVLRTSSLGEFSENGRFISTASLIPTACGESAGPAACTSYQRLVPAIRWMWGGFAPTPRPPHRILTGTERAGQLSRSRSSAQPPRAAGTVVADSPADSPFQDLVPPDLFDRIQTVRTWGQIPASSFANRSLRFRLAPRNPIEFCS